MGFCNVADEKFISVDDISLDSTPRFLIWNGADIESSDSSVSGESLISMFNRLVSQA